MPAWKPPPELPSENTEVKSTFRKDHEPIYYMLGKLENRIETLEGKIKDLTEPTITDNTKIGIKNLSPILDRYNIERNKKLGRKLFEP